jgi:hypothetical protein
MLPGTEVARQHSEKRNTGVSTCDLGECSLMTDVAKTTFVILYASMAMKSVLTSLAS